MLSIKGKGYSKIWSENPFYEEPQPKAFYHPTQEKQLSQSEKQLAFSPKRRDTGKPRQDVQESVEKKFLSGSHAIKPLTSVQTHTPKSPDSSNFDESWPDSERPSSPSIAAEEKWRQESLPYANVRKHAQPTFTSRPNDPDLRSLGKDGGVSRTRSSLMPGNAAEQSVRGPGGVRRKNDAGSRAAEGGSVLQRYIERFRHGAPMSREERQKMEGNQKEFWWLESGVPTPNSTSTPKEEAGRSLPFTSQGQGTLTVENLRKRDDLDVATEELQEKTERMLHSTGSMVSSGPVVSTEGLGSTGSDITGSSFSEPLVRPTYLPREDMIRHPRLEQAAVKGKLSKAPPQEDILYKWRLQRKLEMARQGPYIPSARSDAGTIKTAAEKDIERRLTVFKETLIDRGSVVKTHLQQARVERDMKQVQTVMDTGVQTSPLKSPSSSSSSHHHLPTAPPSFLTNIRNSSSCQTEYLGTPTSKPDITTEHGDVHSPHGSAKDYELHKDPVTHASKQSGSETSVVSSDVKYRQFLEAEKPHDGGDTGNRYTSTNSPRTDFVCTANTDQPDSDKESCSSSSRQVKQVVHDADIVRPHEGGDASVTTDTKRYVPDRKSSRGSEADQKDFDSDNCSLHSESWRKEQKCDSAKDTTERRKNRQERQKSPRQNGSENKNRVRPEKCVKDTQAVETVSEELCDSGMKVHHGKPPTDLDTTPTAQQRLGVERSQSSRVPLPQYTSSPSRPSVSSAIGQVVHDRMFDMSTSVMSSVDSMSSLQRSFASPLPTVQQSSVSDCKGESDGEFEDDPLLLVLRQQRQQHEAQLRLLDSILSERDES